MPRPTEPELLPGADAPVLDEATLTGLTVEGALPAALAGQFVRIGPNPLAPPTDAPSGRVLGGMVHAVALRPGRPVAYRNRWVTTDAVARALGIDPVTGPAPAPVDIVATNIVIFGDRILALGQGALAYELDDDLATLGRIDLAGGGRGICAHPQIDPFTGALHLVSHARRGGPPHRAAGGSDPAHRPIGDAPGPVEDVLLTGDRVVFLGDGFVGVTDRTGEARPHWLDAHLAGAVNAHDEGRAVTVLATGTSLDRWTIAGGSPGTTCSTTRLSASADQQPHRARPEYLWSIAAVGGTELYRHDLRTGRRTSHDFGAGHHPGEFSFVADPSRFARRGRRLADRPRARCPAQRGRPVRPRRRAARAPPLATVHIPRRVPHGLHGTWAPASRRPPAAVDAPGPDPRPGPANRHHPGPDVSHPNRQPDSEEPDEHDPARHQPPPSSALVRQDFAVRA